MVSRKQFDQATARAAKRKARGPVAVEARYDRRVGRIVVMLSTGLEIAFAPKTAQGLEKALPKDLDQIEISPSGFGLHFPKLDADVFLPGLLEGFLGSRRWMAAQLGQRGGRVRSVVKTEASRANGKLGGRPRKTAKRQVHN